MTETTATPTRRRAKFHPLRVSDVRPLTSESIEVAFEVPSDLASGYTYKPGQYVALRANIDGQELRRSYSICQAPTPGEIRIAIKHDLGGLFSTWANTELKAGDVLEVMNPEGSFTVDLEHAEGKHFVGIVAGSGITPVMALTRSILSQTETARVTIIYSNRTLLDVMFFEELADLKDKYTSRFVVDHVFSREGRDAEIFSGRVTQEKLDQLLASIIVPAQVDEWFLCGPLSLVDMCRETLATHGVDAKNIHFELFTTAERGAAERSAEARQILVDPSDETYELEITLDGRTTTVESPVRANESILNAALRVRADVPFACAGGVCGTCRAKLISGSVHMTENYALEPDELEAGYVLTCQSHPTTETVSVNYDV